MARTYSIAQIEQSGGPGVPGKITLAAADGDVTASFAGRFYRDDLGATLPGYTAPESVPPGYTFITATTFEVVDNSSYNGRYIVYSPTDVTDAGVNPSSELIGPNTVIRVNEVIGAPAVVGDDLNTGSVTNISTFLIAIAGEPTLVVPPTVIFSDRPLEVVGRNGSPWGEAYTQNFIELAQNFSSGSAPVNPYLGQTWYDSTLNTYNLKVAGGWVTLASGVAGSNSTYRHHETVAGTTWVVTHNLGLDVPFICLIQVFVDTGGGVHKMMLPSDITFDSVNQLTITFSSAQSGYALIRP